MTENSTNLVAITPMPTGFAGETVRAFLAQTARLRSWSFADLQKAFGIEAATVRAVVGAFAMIGYVETDPADPSRWRNTRLGDLIVQDFCVRSMTPGRKCRARDGRRTTT